jgi:hypothetical protein
LSTIKKVGNVLLIILGVFLILTGILSAKIRNPRFQTYLADQLTTYFSKKLHTELRIGSVDFKLFHHLELKDVLIEDQKRDTILFAKRLDLSFGLFDMIGNKYLVKKITMDESYIYLHKFAETDEFNFQFIADAFAGDTTGRVKPFITAARS